jgi:membrane-associated phospholipid phosphatase
MGRVLARAASVDASIYARIAATDTPRLDGAMVGLSRAADHGVLWFGTAGALAVFGGPRGRLAGREGVKALALASASANLIGKPLANRVRPVQIDLGVHERRRGRMPGSSSFPSGHTASALAFATAAGAAAPSLRPALLALSGLVGYSRVHTGVHYPADVIAGAAIGLAAGKLVRVLALRTPGDHPHRMM